MSYDYQTEKANLFTEEGVKILIHIRDRIKSLLDYSGAFTASQALQKCSGSSWTMLAALDYLVETKEIVKVGGNGRTQQDVYTTSNKEN